MVDKGGGKKTKKKRSGKSSRAPKSDALVVEPNHVEELSEGNNSDDVRVPPSEGKKGQKRKRPVNTWGISSRTRAKKTVSNVNEPNAVQEESTRERETNVISLSLDTESEDMSSVSSKERQPPQPLELYFKSTEYPKTCKIQTKCKVKDTVDVIKKLEEVSWFTSHPQFCHFFHMHDEKYLKLQAMWMLLMHTISIEGEDAAWFAVNGVPIRYSMREHALISGLNCHEYPSNYLELRSTKFVDCYFSDLKNITITDVELKLKSMGTTCTDRLKMDVLFFLGRVIRGNTKDATPLDPFILRIVDNLDVCRDFPWGRLTFEDAIKEIKHVMERLKGEVKDATTFNGFVIPLELLAFECIPKLGEKFRITTNGAIGNCPRMCKSRFTKNSMKGYPLEDIYAAFGKTKTINSVLVPTVDEETLLARIIDPEPEYHREGSTSDRWNYWLNVKHKKIWWKELYESDVAAREFTKTKEKEKVTIVEGSSSNSGLESILKGLEERVLKAMEEGFSGINFIVDTKLEAMYWTLGELDKNQRLLKRRAKKIEDRLTSIESKGNEEKNYFEDMGGFGDYGGASPARDGEKDNENGDKDKENVENQEQEQDPEKDKISDDEQDVGQDAEEEAERKRAEEADIAWRRLRSESETDEDGEKKKNSEIGDKDSEQKEESLNTMRDRAVAGAEETPTPPRGRIKAAAARRQVSLSPEEWTARIVGKTVAELGEKVVETVAEKMVVEEEKKDAEKMVVEEEKKDEEPEAEKYTEEEKQGWMVVYKRNTCETKLDEVEENSEHEEQESDEEDSLATIQEKSRVQAEALWDAIEENEKRELAEIEAEKREAEKNEAEKKKAEEALKSDEEVEEPEEAAKPDVGAARTGIHHRSKMAVKGGITKGKKKDEPMKAAKKKAQATAKKRGRGKPKKSDATLKPCTPLPEKRKCEPSRFVKTPFTAGKFDEQEVPVKKLKTKA